MTPTLVTACDALPSRGAFAPAPRKAQDPPRMPRKIISTFGLSVTLCGSIGRGDRDCPLRQLRDQRRIVGRLGDDADMSAGHRARNQHHEFGIARIMFQDQRRVRGAQRRQLLVDLRRCIARGPATRQPIRNPRKGGPANCFGSQRRMSAIWPASQNARDAYIARPISRGTSIPGK